jgi:putative hydrolase of the HAD superfamily
MLKSEYRLFLLSNTNAIHISEFFKILTQTFGVNPFPQIFEHCYYSHELNLRKPDTAIFHKVCREQNLIPAETFFIDDSPQHVTGAQQAGLHAHWLNIEKETVIDFFTNARWLK